MIRRSPRPLAWRLALAMTAVTVSVVALFAAIMLLVTRSDINQLSVRRAVTIQTTVTRAASEAYRTSGGWASADLTAAMTEAAQGGVRVRVIDTDGHVVATGGARAAPTTVPAQLLVVQSAGRVVGNVELRFPSTYAASAADLLRTRLAVATGLVAGLSVLIGLGVAVAVARRVTRPVRVLSEAVSTVNAGDTDVRVGHLSSVLELESLGEGLDALTATLQRQDQLRKSLVADVAHELRTPVSVLQAACEAIVDGVVTPSRQAASSMLEEVRRLGSRIRDLDALAAAESAGLGLTREPVDLAAVAQEAAQAAHPVFEEAGVSLTTFLVPAVVQGDRHRLHQVMTNLLLNAAKYTPAGGTTRVTVRPEHRDAVARVSDSGVGIPPDELPQVFRRFWRGHRTSTSEGSGVGLAIVSELVRAHHGTVEVASEAGVGTEFTVRIPLGDRSLAAASTATALPGHLPGLPREVGPDPGG